MVRKVKMISKENKGDKTLSLIIRLQLFWYSFVLIITWGLSFLGVLDRTNMVVWYVLALIAGILLFGREIYQKLKKPFRLNFFKSFLLLLFILTFVQGVFSAPNTTDSMVYHLPRVMYWIQDKSVFQHVIRTTHDYMPPFAEYLLLNIYLLVGSDRLLFLSQWIGYVSSIFLSGLIARKLGAIVKVEKAVMLLVATLPIMVIQSVSTQTDLVVLNLFLISLYIVLADFGENNPKNIFWLGLALGLGILTKQTFYFFSIIPLGILAFLSRKNMSRLLRSATIVAGLLALILTSYFRQNMNLFGNFLGRNILVKDDANVNAIFTVPVTVSNVVRDMVINIPIPIFYDPISSSFERLHSLLGLGVNDNRTTFTLTQFSLSKVIYPQEDVAGNPVHLMLIIFTFLALCWKTSWKNKITLLVYGLTMVSLVAFCAIFRWQPFINRLLMPFFVVGSVAGVIILSNYKLGKIVIRLSLIVSLPVAVLFLLLNTSRPYISYKHFLDNIPISLSQYFLVPQAFWERPRDMQYFNPRWYWYEPYSKVVENFVQNESYTVSFDLMDKFEYPFWVILQERGVKYNVVNLTDADSKTYVISTSEKPLENKRYNTVCYATQIEYGYACLSREKESVYE